MGYGFRDEGADVPVHGLPEGLGGEGGFGGYAAFEQTLVVAAGGVAEDGGGGAERGQVSPPSGDGVGAGPLAGGERGERDGGRGREDGLHLVP